MLNNPMWLVAVRLASAALESIKFPLAWGLLFWTLSFQNFTLGKYRLRLSRQVHGNLHTWPGPWAAGDMLLSHWALSTMAESQCPAPCCWSQSCMKSPNCWKPHGSGLQIEGPLDNVGNRCSQDSDLLAFILEFKHLLISPLYCWGPHTNMLNVNGNIFGDISYIKFEGCWKSGHSEGDQERGDGAQWGTEQVREEASLLEPRPEQQTSGPLPALGRCTPQCGL